MKLEILEREFEEKIIKKDGVFIIFFVESWNIPNQKLNERLLKISDSYDKVNFVPLNFYNSVAIRHKHRLRNSLSVMCVKNGKIEWRMENPAEDIITKKIHSILS